MRVLLLGAHGMLGADLREAFSDTECLAWGKRELDVTDEMAVRERVQAAEPDVVMNATAFTDVERAEAEQEEADAVNGYAVGALAVTCALLRIPLLHISTEMVFGQEHPGGYSEAAEPVTPLNAYGRSKLLGETLLRENTERYWLVRTAWLFGLHGKNFFTKIEESSLGKETLPVVHDVLGSPTYTKDLAEGVRALVDAKAPFGVYHLVNRGAASRAECAEEYLRLRGRDVTVQRVSSEDFPLRTQRQKISILHNTKRPALRPWQEALAAYVVDTS